MPVRRRVVALPLFALATAVAALAPAAVPALAGVEVPCGTGATSVENGGFETPGVSPETFVTLPADQVPPWRTTDVLGEIELWGDNFNGLPAAEGTTYAELNAYSAGTLYQDIVTSPGATMTWTLQHRGREGEDTMRVLIGDAGTADVTSDEGWDAISDDLVDDTTAWGEHSNSYVVPEGQTCTRFAFRAIGTSSGDASVGNFLDDISFVITIPADPTPTPAAPKPTHKATPPPTDTVETPTRGGGVGGAGLVVGGLLAISAAAAARLSSRRVARR